MSGADSLCDLDLQGVAEAIARREVTSVEATEAYLRRIERHDAVLRAWVTVTADQALAQAKAADQALAQGRRPGPLHGVPIGLKDLIAVAGVRMTAGSRVLADHVPAHDAHVTERLRAAGAVLLGKLAMHEFAFGRPTNDGPLATGRNPWDVAREPGGSSSGSAVAVAAGLCAGALGSDTGGSIRGPAARCNLVGLKPTYGLVSRHGVVPMCWSLDHVGPMTRTVRDTAAMLQAIAGRDPRDPSTRAAPSPVPSYAALLEAGVRGTRLGVLRRYYMEWTGLHDDARAAALAAFDELRRQGAILEDVDVPSLDLAPAAWSAFLAEMYDYHRDTYRKDRESYREGTRIRLMMGALVAAPDLVRAQRIRARLARELRSVLDRVDALVFPGLATPALRFDEISTRELMPAGARHTTPWNLVGLPAVAVPCGASREGLPLSIQIVGRAFDEPTVLRIARAYERATDWHRRRPDPAGWRLS